MEKVVVTGGGGFIGLELVRRLVARGAETVVAGRSHSAVAERLGARILCGDVRDREFVLDACGGADAVFHLAAKTGSWGRWPDFYSHNVLGTENVIAACREHRVPILVYASSSDVVCSGEHLSGVNELTPYARRYVSPYPRSKAAAEKLVLAASDDRLATTALRLQLVFGPRDPYLVPMLVRKGAERSLRRVGDGHNLVDVGFVDNVAQAFLLAADNLKGPRSAAGHAYFISQGEPVNLWSWLNRFLRRLDLEPAETAMSYRQAYLLGAFYEICYACLRIRRVPPMTRYLAQQLGRAHWFSIEKAHRHLGYSPTVSTAEAINRVVDWILHSDEG